MAQSSARRGGVVVLPCNGLSARGQVTTLAVDQVTEGFEGLRCVNIVPLMAGVAEDVAELQAARAVVGVAGCHHRCDAHACRQVLHREPDDAFVVGEMLRAEVIERTEMTDEEFRQCALEVASRLVGILGKY